MINDRFLKFAYEKNNIKTKFTTNNIIHILFYSENNSLLSKVLEKDIDLYIQNKEQYIIKARAWTLQYATDEDLSYK